MKTMRCSCCGNEVKETERYCSACGQNNDGYVETKTIERVEIYQKPVPPPTYSQPQPTYHQTNIYQQHTYQPPKQESGALAICALVFSILGGWLGLVLSIIGLCTYTTPEHRTKCKIGLGFVIGWFVFGLLIGFLPFLL